MTWSGPNSTRSPIETRASFILSQQPSGWPEFRRSEAHERAK